MADSEVIQLVLESPLSALRSLLFSERSLKCFSFSSDCPLGIPHDSPIKTRARNRLGKPVGECNAGRGPVSR